MEMQEAARQVAADADIHGTVQRLSPLGRPLRREVVAAILSALEITLSIDLQEAMWNELAKRGAKRPTGADFVWLLCYHGRRNQPACIADKLDRLLLRSPVFEWYYSNNGATSPQEWEAFMAALHTALPVVFRLWDHATTPALVRRFDALPFITRLPLGRHVFLCTEDDFHSQTVDKLPFNEWCRVFSTGGALSFQELSSLLPPLLAGLQPHHSVLDLCAAPGSKSSQSVQLMTEQLRRGVPMSGVVVCNDGDLRKASQVLPARMQPYACPGVLVTHAAGAGFANFLPRREDIDPITDRLLYDRVFADVPCSGDGTLRKNPEAWHTFDYQYGVQLHWRQFQLLRRGLSLLRPGGRLIYSTCSFDPVQNEAVVLAMLATMRDTVMLVPALPLVGVEFRPGLTTWRVPDGERHWYSSYDAVPQSLRVPQGAFRPTMFPSSCPDLLPELRKCVRMYPHVTDCGGFFVAIFERQQYQPIVAPPAALPPLSERGLAWHGPDALPLSDYPAFNWADLCQMYGMELDALPFPAAQLFVKLVSGEPRHVYGLSAAATTYLMSECTRPTAVKLTAAGTMLLTRIRSFLKAALCPWRITSQGLHWLLPHITRRRLILSRAQFLSLLRDNQVTTACLLSSGLDSSGLQDLVTGTFEDGSPQFSLGGVVVLLPQAEVPASSQDIAVPGVLCPQFLRLFLDRVNVGPLLWLLGVPTCDYSPL